MTDKTLIDCTAASSGHCCRDAYPSVSCSPAGKGAVCRTESRTLGRVVVDWDVNWGRLQWLVEATDLPWPAVKVHALRRRGRGKGEAER